MGKKMNTSFSEESQDDLEKDRDWEYEEESNEEFETCTLESINEIIQTRNIVLALTNDKNTTLEEQ
jgi:hypothetical protein